MHDGAAKAGASKRCYQGGTTGALTAEGRRLKLTDVRSALKRDGAATGDDDADGGASRRC